MDDVTRSIVRDPVVRDLAGRLAGCARDALAMDSLHQHGLHEQRYVAQRLNDEAIYASEVAAHEGEPPLDDEEAAEHPRRALIWALRDAINAIAAHACHQAAAAGLDLEVG